MKPWSKNLAIFLGLVTLSVCILLTPTRVGFAQSGDAGQAPSRALQGPHIWFFPNDPPRGVVDYMQMFEPGAPWVEAASHVEVFGIHPQFLKTGSDEELATVFRWLNEHHIALALAYGMLHPHKCGGGIEGYCSDQVAMAQKIKRLGGDLRFLLADEPLAHGHYYRGPRQCASPISDLARDAASAAREYQSVFPNIQFMLGEPVSGSVSPANVRIHLADLGRFLTEFHENFGQPFMAVSLDISWSEASESVAREYVNYLRRIGMPVAPIYNSTKNASSNREWMEQARRHFREFEALIGSPPDYAVLNSWNKNPTRRLPEASPEAFTSLILDYSNFSAKPPVENGASV